MTGAVRRGLFERHITEWPDVIVCRTEREMSRRRTTSRSGLVDMIDWLMGVTALTTTSWSP